MEALSCKVDSNMNSELLKPYTPKEITAAITHMAPLKSLGPDGMPPIFFHKYWHIVKGDVFKCVFNILNDRVLDPSLNSTHITLIPKCNKSELLTQFCPISLCNVVMRITTKCIANRLKPLLDRIISPVQSAFIPGRLITDNVLIAFEINHFLKNKSWGKLGHMALKLDISKAYDKVEWSFLRKPSQLHLDLGFYLSWYDCARHYKSSSYQPVLFNSSLCTELHTNSGGGCYGKPGPGCSNDTCSYFPENPVTGKGGIGLLLTNKFALPTAKSPAQFGPVSHIVLSCTYPDKFSKNYRGLAKGSTGLAMMGRFNYSLSAQISRGSSAPWIFALCLPSSSNASGVALFNSAGPYNFSPKIEVSKLLTYTPLISGPEGSDTQIFYWYKSPDYYIGPTSFRVNRKVVVLNQTLLAIDENGLGGTKLSTSEPYTVLQSSIFKVLTDAFVKESDALNLTRVKPVAPFSLCYAAYKIPRTRIGPVVPAIDLVLGNKKVLWRIQGSNSMMRIKNEDADAWCLGFVDGGDAPKTSIVIGGHQLEDNLVQFDLENERLGFSSSLLLRGTTCANFDFKPNLNYL
ncbi:UNVERIFIED_CONTAM: putative aspartic proteinase GIP2 [Sesamum latifolium]|uniref:Aspartic proteinase GIP2 n=1 Tax=Sesamum latifolium TaxID=2727402 RepID=A0AAW2XZ99_9LAMI